MHLYLGKELYDSCDIHSYGIRKNSTVHLTARLPGGGLGYIHIQPGLRQLAEKYNSEKMICRSVSQFFWPLYK